MLGVYSSYLGRFINRDPIAEASGLNLFAYCNNEPIASIDPTGLQTYNKIDNAEIINDYHDAGVLGGIGGRLASMEAVNDANHSGLIGPVHGPMDAYRHCVWSCIMAQRLGQDIAETIGMNHEMAGDLDMGQKPDDKNMDLANNAAGREAAKCKSKPCKDTCMLMLQAGQLVGRGPIPLLQLYGPAF